MLTTILIACGAALLVGAVLYVLLRPREADPRLDRLLVEVAAVRGSSESMDRRVEDLRRSVGERVAAVEDRLAAGQKDVSETLGDVREKIGRVFESSQKVERLAGDMTRLEDLLKPPKIRGNLGETFLEQTLREALPPDVWTMRHVFSDGTVVDAAVRVGPRIVPIDSKFPLENFRKGREAADDAERRRARRDFAGDVRKHVEAIRKKYIRPFDGTFDFALMYVPAEAVYCEIVSDEDAPSLTEFAAERRVILVSPSLLYVYLATVAIGLRGMELEKSAHEVLGRLAELEKQWEKVEGPFEVLGTHLRNSHAKYEETARALDRFGERLSTLAERELEEALESDIGAPPLPPPS
ncbi:MAG TPA: DNA recombination protein RmuC [Thermoanaerobaculia bacterium]|nr:DNA recombination protein RmuC [Thermoanaerobaculia bacterium]